MAVQTPELRAMKPGSRSGRADTLRIETGSGAEHRAGDVEQAVGHRAQGAGVPVAAAAQLPILVVADRVALCGDAGQW